MSKRAPGTLVRCAAAARMVFGLGLELF